jgi:hypothetical protein
MKIGKYARHEQEHYAQEYNDSPGRSSQAEEPLSLHLGYLLVRFVLLYTDYGRIARGVKQACSRRHTGQAAAHKTVHRREKGRQICPRRLAGMLA